MKILYFFDDKKVFDHSEMVEDDYLVPDNMQATEIKPEDGLYEPVTFDGTKWTGVTREEFLANQPEPEHVGPTEQDLINAQLLQQSAAQQMTNAEIIKEIATIKGGN